MYLRRLGKSLDSGSLWDSAEAAESETSKELLVTSMTQPWRLRLCDFFCVWWGWRKDRFCWGFGEECAQNVVVCGWLVVKSVASVVSGRLFSGSKNMPLF